ncbi:MAG: hypothetical protein ACP5FH_11305, partial [Terracidiphilus sp.]
MRENSFAALAKAARSIELRRPDLHIAARRATVRAAFAFLVFSLPAAAGAQRPAPPAHSPAGTETSVLIRDDSVLLDAMTTELHRAFQWLGKQNPGKQLPPYFLSYRVDEGSAVTIQAQFGAVVNSAFDHLRSADVRVRVGSPRLDNTHGDHRASAVTTIELPLGDDREAIERSLWLATNAGYGKALDNYQLVKTEAAMQASEEDASPDFSQQAPQVSVVKSAPPLAVDRAAWEQRIAALSKVFRAYPDVDGNEVSLTAQSETGFFVSSEGSRVVA